MERAGAETVAAEASGSSSTAGREPTTTGPGSGARLDELVIVLTATSLGTTDTTRARSSGLNPRRDGQRFGRHRCGLPNSSRRRQHGCWRMMFLLPEQHRIIHMPGACWRSFDDQLFSLVRRMVARLPRPALGDENSGIHRPRPRPAVSLTDWAGREDNRRLVPSGAGQQVYICISSCCHCLVRRNRN